MAMVVEKKPQSYAQEVCPRSALTASVAPVQSCAVSLTGSRHGKGAQSNRCTDCVSLLGRLRHDGQRLVLLQER